jgi:hypothetical protein
LRCRYQLVDRRRHKRADIPRRTRPTPPGRFARRQKAGHTSRNRLRYLSVRGRPWNIRRCLAPLPESGYLPVHSEHEAQLPSLQAESDTSYQRLCSPRRCPARRRPLFVRCSGTRTRFNARTAPALAAVSRRSVAKDQWPAVPSGRCALAQASPRPEASATADPRSGTALNSYVAGFGSGSHPGLPCVPS